MGQSSSKSGVVVWGSPEYGQLGLGNSSASEKASPPRLVESLRNVTVSFISSRGHHSAVVSDGGEAYTWGHGDAGQLGHGDQKDVPLPRLVRALTGKIIRKVYCGDQHSAAASDHGILYTWGLGLNGRLGHGSDRNESSPRAVESLAGYFVTDAACGSFHSMCAAVNPSRSDGKTEDTNEVVVFSWGLGLSGRLGHGDETNRSVPTAVAALRFLTVRKVVCGGHHSGALTHDGILYMWGGGAFGKLGLGSRLDTSLPKVVGAEGDRWGKARRRVTDVSLGIQHSAAVTDAGAVYVWGQAGRLGHASEGIERDEMLPRRVSGLGGSFAVQVSCGHSHTAVVTEEGDVWAWGTSRVLGHVEAGCAPNIPAKVKCLEGKGIVQVVCGQSHTLALSDAGRLARRARDIIKHLKEGTKRKPAGIDKGPFRATDKSSAETSGRIGKTAMYAAETSDELETGKGLNESITSIGHSISHIRQSIDGNSEEDGGCISESGGVQRGASSASGFLKTSRHGWSVEGREGSEVTDGRPVTRDGSFVDDDSVRHWARYAGSDRTDADELENRDVLDRDASLKGLRFGGDNASMGRTMSFVVDGLDGAHDDIDGALRISDQELMRMWQLREINVQAEGPDGQYRKVAVISAELKGYQEQCMALAKAVQDTANKLLKSEQQKAALEAKCEQLQQYCDKLLKSGGRVPTATLLPQAAISDLSARMLDPPCDAASGGFSEDDRRAGGRGTSGEGALMTINRRSNTGATSSPVIKSCGGGAGIPVFMLDSR